MTAHALTDIVNFVQLSPEIATAGQPTAEQFALIKQAGYQLVINLAMPTSTNALPDEAELVAAQGMDYIHIPVVWEQPTLDDLRQFFDALEANAGRLVFVHCALNWRVATFMALYRVIRLGLSSDEAIWDLLSIWEPDETWRGFIAVALAAHAMKPARAEWMWE